MVGLSGNILCTGGSGFLGRALLKVSREEGWDCCWTVYSRDEYKQDVCRQRYPDVRYVLGDVRDRDRLEVAMQGHDIVIHAAALKYIPEAEINVSEAVNVNVDGSRSVVAAAIGARVHTVIGVSTDKAVNPSNVYGASKMLMERLFVEANWGAPRFNLVRYGNVIASTGSVIPVFLRQVAGGGPITITDPHMTRFWLSWREAVALIVRAAHPSLAGGTLVVPETAAMDMRALATAVVESAQGEMSSGVECRIVGPRLGEKQHEAMLTWEESCRAERDGRYFHVGHEIIGEPFVLTSNNPHHWWQVSEMADAIREAQTV